MSSNFIRSCGIGKDVMPICINVKYADEVILSQSNATITPPRHHLHDPKIDRLSHLIS